MSPKRTNNNCFRIEMWMSDQPQTQTQNGLLYHFFEVSRKQNKRKSYVVIFFERQL
jgi:hypothetical protein